MCQPVAAHRAVGFWLNRSHYWNQPEFEESIEVKCNEEAAKMKNQTRSFVALIASVLLGPCMAQVMAQGAGDRLPEGLELDRPASKNAAEKQVEQDIRGLQQALKAAGIAGHHSRARLGHPGGQRLLLAGTIPIEFFFEGRLVR